jgi:hypothetical protein
MFTNNSFQDKGKIVFIYNNCIFVQCWNIQQAVGFYLEMKYFLKMHCFCENWSDLKTRCDSSQWKILQPQKFSFFSSSSTPIQLYFQLTNTVGYSENFLWKTLQWKLRVTLLKSLKLQEGILKFTITLNLSLPAFSKTKKIGHSPGASTIKLFTITIIYIPMYAGVFVATSFVYPSLRLGEHL